MPNKANLPELASVPHCNSTYFILPNGKTDENYRESDGIDHSHEVHDQPCRGCGKRIIWSYMPPVRCDCGFVFHSSTHI